MKLRGKIRERWPYSRLEVRGILILITILVILITFRIIQKSNRNTWAWHPVIADTLCDEEIIRDEASSEELAYSHKMSGLADKAYVTFDPNTVSKAILEQNGFPSEIAARVIKYRDKGGRFTTWKDMYKIYGVDSSRIESLRNYIIIESLTTRQPEGESEPEPRAYLIELNSARAVDLSTLPGIGRVLSERIIKYKELLGGYHAVAQVREVYGISDSLFNIIRPRLVVDSSLVIQISVNSTDFDDLFSHPYVNHADANKILNYRRIQGGIKTREELRDNYIISDSVYQKLAPYLALE